MEYKIREIDAKDNKQVLENMLAAQKFYEKYGFKRIYEPLVKTEHFACEVRYIKVLK